MNVSRTCRKIATLFLRDLAVARSYRIAFLMQFLDTLLGVAAFYYLSRFIQSPELTRSLPQGGSYFSFALVGFAFFDYLGVAINAFDQSLEEARQNGTLEYLIGSHAVWLSGCASQLAGALVVLAVSVLAFAGLGVLSASYLLLFKRGNPVKWFFLGVAGLVSGVMYPVSVLPPPLQWIGRLVPVTYSLEGMRAAMLGHASMATLWPVIRDLLAFAVVLLPLSFAIFLRALRRTKITGTLTHF